MPKYIIEREIPGAAELFSKEKEAIAKKSSAVVKELGQVQWVESYVSNDKLYCVYIAPNEEMVREHGRRGGFPVNRVSEVKFMIDPTTGEG
jgi:hypothetical protein